MIYFEHTEPRSSYGFSKLSLKMPHHFLVLMKLIEARLLKIISKKISKSNLCRMNSGNIFLMSLLKMPFRRLRRRFFLLMLSPCQILRGISEFKFDVAVKKNIWNVTLDILGAKYLSVTREEDLSVIYFHRHTFAKLYFFPIVLSLKAE